jgi:hypothetical protein
LNFYYRFKFTFLVEEENCERTNNTSNKKIKNNEKACSNSQSSKTCFGLKDIFDIMSTDYSINMNGFSSQPKPFGNKFKERKLNESQILSSNALKPTSDEIKLKLINAARDFEK